MAASHQCSLEPVASAPGLDVELLDVAVEALGPQRRTEAKHRHSVCAGAAKKSGHLAGGKQRANFVREGVRAGCRLVELAVERVEEPADGLGVGDVRAAHGEVSTSAHFQPSSVSSVSARSSSW